MRLLELGWRLVTLVRIVWVWSEKVSEMTEELLERSWQEDNPEVAWIWQADDSMDI